MKNILVTGGLGLLGKPLVSFLRKKKNNIFVLDRSKNKKRNSLIKGRNINFIYGNYQNKNFLKKIIKNKKINVIFHTGAVTQVLEGLKYPFKTYKNNIMGTINILECIRQINPSILLIYSSSDKAYGEIKKRNYLENDNLKSIYPYDLSKTCSDLICQSYSKVYNLKIAIVRCGNLFGPGDFNKNRIIPETILSTMKNQRLKIRSSGKLIRDYLYVDDAVKAYFMIMNKLKNKNSNTLIYNVGSRDNLSVVKLVNMILTLMNRRDLKPIILNKSKKELKFQKLNDNKIRKELGWKQSITINKALSKTINWYKENRNLF
ncbi:NAD-dependent epimerase/dehydratase family protein [Candidatus Pelagibacter communis]|uniref:NAD-dependent epimerase/dehydratase family protein n=1 Tax=Pelagibacter ubique TaxID=198252 RepID=UPI00094C1C9F|nr:NAD-dependent epimerase/dehydratase family protein [Candidatus Pelagibacter ubique]